MREQASALVAKKQELIAAASAVDLRDIETVSMTIGDHIPFCAQFGMSWGRKTVD